MIKAIDRLFLPFRRVPALGGRSGYTMVEMIIVAIVVGILALVGPGIIVNVSRFYKQNDVRLSLQTEARTILMTIVRHLRQAKRHSLVIDRVDGNQPPFSRIAFDLPAPTPTDPNAEEHVAYYQWNDAQRSFLTQAVGGQQRVLSDRLASITFALPQSSDMGLVSMSLTLKEKIFENVEKNLIVTSEKVKVMNP